MIAYQFEDLIYQNVEKYSIKTMYDSKPNNFIVFFYVMLGNRILFMREKRTLVIVLRSVIATLKLGIILYKKYIEQEKERDNLE